MTNEKDKPNNKLAKKLSEQRTRKGKEKLTDKELLDQQYRIRDGASEWLEQCVIYGKKDGVKDAQQLMDHSMSMIKKLEKEMKGKK